MSRIRSLWKILVGILREIGDETPYARHLARRHRAHCGEEWRRFSDERLRAKYSRAKCC